MRGRARLHFECLLCDGGGSGRRQEARVMVVRVMTSLGETLAVLDGLFPERRSIATEKPRARGGGYAGYTRSNA